MANMKDLPHDTTGDKSDNRPAVLAIGGFTLRQASQPGKIQMTSPSGEATEVDEKVLEDLLASFF